MFGKIDEMQSRLAHVKELLPLVHQKMVDNHIPGGIGTERSDWRAQQPIAQLISKETADPSIQRVYQECAPLPKLELLDKFRDDGQPSLMYYSYPQFFMEQWRELMEKETSTKKKKRMTKIKKRSTTGGSSVADAADKRSSPQLKQVQVEPTIPEESSIFAGGTDAENQNDEYAQIRMSTHGDQQTVSSGNTRTVEDEVIRPQASSSIATRSASSTQLKSSKKTAINLSEMSNALDALIDDFNTDPEQAPTETKSQSNKDKQSIHSSIKEKTATSVIAASASSSVLSNHEPSIRSLADVQSQSIPKSQSRTHIPVPPPPPPPPTGPLPKIPVETHASPAIPPPPPMPTSIVPPPPPPAPSHSTASPKPMSMGPLKIPENPVLRKTSGPEKHKPQPSLSDITSGVLSSAASRLKKPAELAPLQNVPTDARSVLLDSIRGKSVSSCFQIFTLLGSSLIAY